MNDETVEFGTLLRNARRRARLSQAQLAEAMGTTPEYIAQVERGLENPPLLTMVELARAVGCRLEYEITPTDIAEREVASPARIERWRMPARRKLARPVYN